MNYVYLRLLLLLLVFLSLLPSFTISSPSLPPSLPPLLPPSAPPSLLPPSPPVLRESHQEEVLSLMTDTHLNMMDELCQVFRLRSADTNLLIDLVHRLLAEDKMKEVRGRASIT